MALLNNKSQLHRWKASVKALDHFLKTTGIHLELSQGLTFRLLDHTIVLGRIQKLTMDAGKDVRNMALSHYHPGQKQHLFQKKHRKTSTSKRRKSPTLPSREECLRYMKYATAVYGESMIRAAEVGVRGMFDGRFSPLTRTRVSEHIGVPEEDIVLVDMDYGGDVSHLRHFVAVDHQNQKVVLAIRGTFSVADVFVNVAGFSSKCSLRPCL